MILEELKRELLNGEDPYDFAQRRHVDRGYPHTFLPPELVNVVLTSVKPTFWLEIGSMVGGSANLVAKAARDLQYATQVVCIDPFTADVGAWENAAKEAQWDCLRLEGGRPTIYERFLASVRDQENHARVLPLCMTSSVGTRLLRNLKASGRISELPTVIYLDSAHEAGETLLEIQNAWDLLPPGGVLFGDDWDWPAVESDVRQVFGISNFNGTDARLVSLAKKLPGARVMGRILLYKNQWLVLK